MDGATYITLLERAYGSVGSPGQDWSESELAWQGARNIQLGRSNEFTPRKEDVVDYAKRYIREQLLNPILEVLDDEHAAMLRHVPIGLVNIRTLNAQALRAPNGDPVIIFNAGILQIVSHWWERQFLLWRTSFQSQIASTRHLLETYSFTLMLIQANGRVNYPPPTGRLGETDRAHIVRNSLQLELFILAHEVSHIVLNHPLSSPQVGGFASEPEEAARQGQLSRENELEADINGYLTYTKAWPRSTFSGGGDINIRDMLGPLEYFKILRLVENNPEVIPDYGQSSNHPTAIERADMVLRLILYSHGGPDESPEIAQACTEMWELIRSMPNIVQAFTEFAGYFDDSPAREERE